MAKVSERCASPVVVAAAAVWLGVCGAGVFAQGAPAADATTPRIWQGVYTAAQAERGKATYTSNCLRCHGGDLLGVTAPSLTGERFMASWSGEHVGRLYEKIRDTMPPNFGSVIDNTAKLEVVAYILQTNGFPAGTGELAVDPTALAALPILRRGEQPRVQNFALVQTIGCLTRATDSRWQLTKTAEPVTAREDVPDAAALAAAADAPLGAQTFLLLSARPFNPESHVGMKVVARGLVYRNGSDARLTLTALQTLGPCT
jgi:S-disulfanyl-L-cysteine oxidoreductase SoxD